MREKVPLTSQEMESDYRLNGAGDHQRPVLGRLRSNKGNTLQIFADRNADWHAFGFEMPSTWFQAVNPMFIFALTPLLISFWGWQSRAGKEPGSITKMAMGCVLLGISFVPLIYIAHGLGETQRISFLWLVGSTCRC